MTGGTDATAPKIYGWCPGALRPMMSGDGLVVRIRAPLGRLSSQQAQAIAALSLEHGNGLIDLSARANLQLRGVKEPALHDLIRALQDLGLVEQEATAEARRNVLVSPFWQPNDTSHAIADELNAALAEATDLVLPGKFGFAVDCGITPQLQDTAADIRIERSGADLLLVADGAQTGLPVQAAHAVEEALALARWFLDQGGAPEGRGRMHPLIARRGPPPAHVADRATHAPQQGLGPTATGRLVALEFGQISAHDFDMLAQLGPLRLTPWRMLLVEGVHDIAAQPGLILDARDPRLQVRACTGAPGCLQALSATRDLARDLAPFVPEGALLHVSGCAKGCAHPGSAAIVLTATAPDTFDLIHHGKAADQPLRETLSASALRSAPTILTEGS
jgi:precorrin-3B synthase